MTKSAKGEGGRKAAPGQLWLHLPGMVREALYDTVIGAGRACVDEVLERERVALCGERYAHLADRQAQRAGHVASSLVLGVSTRGCARSLEQLPEALTVRGISKSAVSERFVYATERKLAELMSRALRQGHVVVLLIDGVHFGEHVVLAAVGVDAQGDKHVLGLREGATENAAAVRALLADLIERGLAPERAMLIVIDGAKALHKAVVEVFGAHALIQRYREHKKRNVTDALPERLRGSIRSAMNQAYTTRDPKHAWRLLESLARRLDHQHPGAAASLREGLEETLTVMRLRLPANLERVLSSTNLIENLFGAGCARSAAGSNAGRTAPWCCAGPPRRCSKPSAALANSPAIARCRSWSPHCALTTRSSIARLTILKRPLK